MIEFECIIDGEDAMLEFGRCLARCAKNGALVFLQGDLGAGKTTIVRGLLRGLGWNGKVKSPTFTLVEPYEFTSNEADQLSVFHFDLYRLASGDELEYLGIRDYLQSGNLCLIEWPERGQGILPEADLGIAIYHDKRQRRLVIRSNEVFSSCLQAYKT